MPFQAAFLGSVSRQLSQKVAQHQDDPECYNDSADNYDATYQARNRSKDESHYQQGNVIAKIPAHIADDPAHVEHSGPVAFKSVVGHGRRHQKSQGHHVDHEQKYKAVSYTHLRAHETVLDIVCRL